MHEYLQNEIILLVRYSFNIGKCNEYIDIITHLLDSSDKIYSNIIKSTPYHPISRRDFICQIYLYAIGTYISASSVLFLNWQKSWLPEYSNIWNNALKKQIKVMNGLHYRLDFISPQSLNFMPTAAMIACQISNDLYDLVKQHYT